MSRKLSAQEKLALSLTSAGSMRELGRRLGVSHQKIGRWLREGEAGGAKQIPPDFFVQTAIDGVFADHKDRAREAARRERMPYNPEAPVMFKRLVKADGTPADKAIVPGTEFIRADLRADVIHAAARSGRITAASVRSRVSLRDYFRNRAAADLASGASGKHIPLERLAREMLHGFTSRESAGRREPIAPETAFPLYTRLEGMSRRRTPSAAVKGIVKQMQTKHDPAIGAPGTVAADQYLFHLKERVPPHEKAPPSRPKRRR